MTSTVAPQRSAERLYKHPALSSVFLPTKRDLIVYLPPDYDDDPLRRFPVLYLQDGQNLFDPDTAYVRGMDWRVHSSADTAVREKRIRSVIVVGIGNAGRFRVDEYTPTADKRLGGGLGPLYGRMLVEEILPFIDRNYRTLSGPENTGIGGSSMGGLISLYLGLAYPGLFGRVAVLSPSLWWNARSILGWVRQSNPEPRPRIWLDIGTRENAIAVRDTIRLNQILVSQGWREGESLRFRCFEGALHNEAAWAERVAPMLAFLFPPGDDHPGEVA